ncbi:hypothetical protein [Lysinibacillus xylanilyticus]
MFYVTKVKRQLQVFYVAKAKRQLQKSPILIGGEFKLFFSGCPLK